MIRKIILENGRYVGKGRLDEGKSMNDNIANKIIYNAKLYYFMQDNSPTIKKTEVHKMYRDNIIDLPFYNDIKKGRYNLNMAFEKNNEYASIIINLLNGKYVSPKDMKIIEDIIANGVF